METSNGVFSPRLRSRGEEFSWWMFLSAGKCEFFLASFCFVTRFEAQHIDSWVTEVIDCEIWLSWILEVHWDIKWGFPLRLRSRGEEFSWWRFLSAGKCKFFIASFYGVNRVESQHVGVHCMCPDVGCGRGDWFLDTIALISVFQWDSSWRFRPIGGAEEENSRDEFDQLFLCSG